MRSEVSYLAAFSGGFVSFLSPCVLPLVPAYLALIGGVGVGDLRDGEKQVRLRILRRTALFVGGFTLVFVVMGLSASSLQHFALRNQDVLETVAGVTVFAMSVFLIFTSISTSPRVQAEYRFHPDLSRVGILAAPVAGAAFALGWTPCIGPILGSILAIASLQSAMTEGALLLALYSLGLGIPFLLAGLAFGKLAGLFSWARSHSRLVNVCSATMLALFGLLILTGHMTKLNSLFS